MTHGKWLETAYNNVYRIIEILVYIIIVPGGSPE
jgi:hypothetical protein